MITMLAAAVFLGMLLTALYAFGIFSTPYTDAFRFGFYLLLVMVFVAVVFSLGRHPLEGYDPTPASP
jgi:hypothetical protein